MWPFVGYCLTFSTFDQLLSNKLCIARFPERRLIILVYMSMQTATCCHCCQPQNFEIDIQLFFLPFHVCECYIFICIISGSPEFYIYLAVFSLLHLFLSDEINKSQKCVRLWLFLQLKIMFMNLTREILHGQLLLFRFPLSTASFRASFSSIKSLIFTRKQSMEKWFGD